MQPGRILGIVGGILAFVGTLLPWTTISGGGTSVTLSGVIIFFFGIPVLVFGIIGLVLVYMHKKGTTIGAVIMGILALIFAILAVSFTSMLASLASVSGTATVMIEYGIYVSIVGSVLLMVGGALAYLEACRAVTPAPYAEMPPTNG